ncbi:MAG: hypothetical protein QOH25_1784 [Acidobacteriota bacterium]|nr:hypothetical protein [Acidobacteriota bacterium]
MASRMNIEYQPADPHLFNLTAKAVEEGLARVSKLVADKKYIGTYFKFPKISYSASGMPEFSQRLFSGGPTDYKEAFGRKDDKPVRLDQVPSFIALFDYIDSAESCSRLRAYFSSTEASMPTEEAEKVSSRNDSFYQRSKDLFISGIVDRYIHLHGDAPFSLEHFAPIYLLLESGIFKETLPIDIVVPILFLQFNFERASLGTDMSIERMDEGFQLARFLQSSDSTEVKPSVMGAATHALILHDWEFKNRRYYEAFNTYYVFSTYPLNQIESFFTALRIATGASTGYAQLLMRPLGWAHSYEAHLPPVEGISIRRYPSWFEYNDWREPTAAVTEQDALEAGNVFSKFTAVDDKRLALASRRLNLCLIRETEEDSILDATIAMEALLSDDERQEMTHKLALRMAALSGLSNEIKKTPVEVYRDVKHIYRFRSAVVHGSTKASAKREIAVSGEEKVPTVTAAINYLRMAIKVLIDNPKYLNPSKIDEDLLLGKQVSE